MRRVFSILLIVVLILSAMPSFADDTIPVKKITLSETKQLTLAPLISWRITAQVYPENATNQEITWSTSSDKIASVDSNGIVTGVSPGTATITAVPADGGKVKATVKIKVEKFDYVFEDTKPQNMEYTIVPGNRHVRAKAEKGCVSVVDPDLSILLIGMRSTETVKVTPVKPGPDVVSITGSGENKKIKVFVSPAAFPEFGTAALPAEDESAEILFLGIPWGSTYAEAKQILQEQGKKLKNPAQRDDYIRAWIDGEINFATCTATQSALDFSYTPGDESFMSNNAMFKGIQYFDPQTPFDQLRLAVKSVYGLDYGNLNGDVCYWEKGDVTITLTQKDRFIILEVSEVK